MAPAMFRRTFSALSVRNFRFYITGQLISMTGTWMQTVAEALLVLQLTGKGTAVGVVTALQFVPVLFLGPVGGVIADRFERRTILYSTQAAAAILALVLGVLVATDTAQLWMVYVLAAGLGVATALDNPARQTFVFELVGPGELTNAVGLNSGMVNLARVIGPALAAILIATVGIAACFFYNAASFVAVLIALALMRSSQFHRTPVTPHTKGQLRAGFRYVRHTPELLAPLLMLAVIGLFTMEFPVTLPLFAKFTFHGGASAYGAMASLMGVGALVGTLIVASRARPTGRSLVFVAVALGIVLLVASAAPTLPIALVLMVPLGGLGVALMALANITLQLTTRPEMRGRVMALWFVAFAGTTPIGAPIVGWIADNIGARYGLAIGGIAAVLAGLLAYPTLVRRPERDARGLTAPTAIPANADADVTRRDEVPPEPDSRVTEEIELSS